MTLRNLAYEIYDYDMPNIYLANEKLQADWFHLKA